jgi:hypothetical protein
VRDRRAEKLDPKNDPEMFMNRKMDQTDYALARCAAGGRNARLFVISRSTKSQMFAVRENLTAVVKSRPGANGDF